MAEGATTRDGGRVRGDATADVLSAIAYHPVPIAVLPTFTAAAALAPSLFYTAPTLLPRVCGHQGRSKIWPKQLEALCAAFATGPSPDGPARARLAVELSMRERSVQVWFQNQRSKVKARDKAAAGERGGADEEGALALVPPPSKRPRHDAADHAGRAAAPPAPTLTLPWPPPSPPLSPPDGKRPSATAPDSPTMVWAPEDGTLPTMTIVCTTATEVAGHWLKALSALLPVLLLLAALGLAREWGYLQILGAPLLAFVVGSALVPVAGPHAYALPYVNGLHFAMAAVRLHTACVSLLGTVPWTPQQLLLLWFGHSAVQEGSSPSEWTLRPEPHPGAHVALIASTAAVVARALITAASGGRLFWTSGRALAIFNGIVIGLRALYEIERSRADASSLHEALELGNDDQNRIVKLSTGASLVAACLLILIALVFCPANRRRVAALCLQQSRLRQLRSRPLRLRPLRLRPYSLTGLPL